MWNEVWWGGLGLLFLLLPLAKQAQGWPGARSPFSRPCSLPPSTRSRQPLRTGLCLGTWFGSCRVGPPALGYEPVTPSCVWTFPPLGGLNPLLFFF